MKTPDPPADGSPAPEAEDPQAQQIDLDDADVSAELASDPRLPPGAPALPAMPALPPAASAPPAPPAPASIAPAPAPSRGPMFYVGLLVGVLVLSAAVGTAVALTRRRAPAPVVAAPTAASATAPKVITIGTIEMDDNPDSGP